MVDFASFFLVSRKKVSGVNGVVIAVGVGGTGVALGGTGVKVGGIGVRVGGTAARVGGVGARVDGIGVEAVAHPLNKTARDTNARKADPVVCFMT